MLGALMLHFGIAGDAQSPIRAPQSCWWCTYVRWRSLRPARSTLRLDMDMVTGTRYPSNTQGVHEWPLHVARLQHSSYHFRSTVAGQADCSTDRHSAGALFTDYHFLFYRHCTY
ncbi:unnamed protein product [Boreogadus saida]